MSAAVAVLLVALFALPFFCLSLFLSFSLPSSAIINYYYCPRGLLFVLLSPCLEIVTLGFPLCFGVWLFILLPDNVANVSSPFFCVSSFLLLPSVAVQSRKSNWSLANERNFLTNMVISSSYSGNHFWNCDLNLLLLILKRKPETKISHSLPSTTEMRNRNNKSVASFLLQKNTLEHWGDTNLSAWCHCPPSSLDDHEPFSSSSRSSSVFSLCLIKWPNAAWQPNWKKKQKCPGRVQGECASSLHFFTFSVVSSVLSVFIAN